MSNYANGPRFPMLRPPPAARTTLDAVSINDVLLLAWRIRGDWRELSVDAGKRRKWLSIRRSGSSRP